MIDPDTLFVIEEIGEEDGWYNARERLEGLVVRYYDSPDEVETVEDITGKLMSLYVQLTDDLDIVYPDEDNEAFRYNQGDQMYFIQVRLGLIDSNTNGSRKSNIIILKE